MIVPDVIGECVRRGLPVFPGAFTPTEVHPRGFCRRYRGPRRFFRLTHACRCYTKIDGKHVEPNSGLGQAIGYLLKHWTPLTLFLRESGALLDNNRAEQALKMAILHRKNSLSYKTLTGARTGDLFMSLIHTCRLNRVKPFAYLLAITNHPEEVKSQPSAWLPWNYPKAATASALDHDPPGHPK